MSNVTGESDSNTLQLLLSPALQLLTDLFHKWGNVDLYDLTVSLLLKKKPYFEEAILFLFSVHILANL